MEGKISAISGDITEDYKGYNGKCPSSTPACSCNNGKHPSLPTSEEPVESWQRIVDHVKKLYPDSTESALNGLIGKEPID